MRKGRTPDAAAFAPQDHGRGSPVRAKPYLDARELAALTPWSVDAIDAMVKRGTLKENRHWFRIPGRRERIFKWEAVVDLVEGRGADSRVPPPRGPIVDRIPMLNGSTLDVPTQA